ncbi:hypothetical protein, partial [Vibrio fluvialis]|uniref:hypothetical protein n=1 Tax=Vibrio fluvialis TaxID=676 RepID=UPI002ACAF22A
KISLTLEFKTRPMAGFLFPPYLRNPSVFKASTHTQSRLYVSMYSLCGQFVDHFQATLKAV